MLHINAPLKKKRRNSWSAFKQNATARDVLLIRIKHTGPVLRDDHCSRGMFQLFSIYKKLERPLFSSSFFYVFNSRVWNVMLKWCALLSCGLINSPLSRPNMNATYERKYIKTFSSLFFPRQLHTKSDWQLLNIFKWTAATSDGN